jgi:hypothetical protein
MAWAWPGPRKSQPRLYYFKLRKQIAPTEKVGAYGKSWRLWEKLAPIQWKIRLFLRLGAKLVLSRCPGASWRLRWFRKTGLRRRNTKETNQSRGLPFASSWIVICCSPFEDSYTPPDFPFRSDHLKKALGTYICRILLKTSSNWHQGDQISFWKYRPKCSPTHFLSKLTRNFYRGIKKPKNQGYFKLLSQKCPKLTIAHWAKIRPIWSHWLPFTFLASFRAARWFVFNPKIPIWVNLGGP